MTARLAKDFSFLHGKQVDQICIGRYQLQIHLSEGCSVSIEGGFHHKGHTPARREELASKGATLVSLLGKTVERVVVNGEMSATIQFSNSEVLTIFVEGGPYESLGVTARGITVVA